MAAICGNLGSVTFASGYVTSAHAWEISASTEALDVTPYAPTSSYESFTGGISDWRGSYRCWQRVTAATTLSGSTVYITNPYRYEVELRCAGLETTAFTAAYKARIAGLLSATGTIESYTDATTALPAPGATATITFTLDTGITYAIPLIVTDATVRSSADGATRSVVSAWRNTGVVVVTGAPNIGVTGAATFLATTSRQYSGNILITSVRWSGTADRADGEFTFGFEGNGTLTAA